MSVSGLVLNDDAYNISQSLPVYEYPVVMISGISMDLLKFRSTSHKLMVTKLLQYSLSSTI